MSLAARIESRLAESSKRAPDALTGRANARPAALNLAEGSEYLTHIRASKPRASANCMAEPLCSSGEPSIRRLALLAAAAGIAVTAFAAMSPAEAAFHLIRWQDSGFCQIWDESIPTNPWPPNYIVIIGSEVPTFGDALVFKDGMLRNGTCSF